jgi:tripartite-type tricarboxylate transporter receptor subunit TctC
MALAGLGLGLPITARAQAWPTRPITIVVSQGPGSGSDISTRILAVTGHMVLEMRDGAGWAGIGRDGWRLAAG